MATVLILDGYTFSALAIVRSLGQLGHRILVASSTSHSIAGASRFSTRKMKSPSAVECPELLVRWIADIAIAEKVDAVFCTTSATMLAIDQFRYLLPISLILDLPPSDIIALAYDKLLTFEIAESKKVPMPITKTWQNDDELERLADTFVFPCIIKPRQSSFFIDGQIVNCGSHHYIYDKDSLMKIARQGDKRFPNPLIQEMIPGYGFGVFILMKDGQVVASFAHQRVREANPLGASSCFRLSIDMPDDAYIAAVNLLKAMKWNGVAMVEFKRDSRDGLPKLMEVNGRFWYSLALCLQAGVDFPDLLLELKLGKEAQVKNGYKVGVGTHWIGGELMHAYKVMKGRPEGYRGSFPTRLETILGMGRDFILYPHSDTFQIRDPFPALYEFWLLMRGIA